MEIELHAQMTIYFEWTKLSGSTPPVGPTVSSHAVDEPEAQRVIALRDWNPDALLGEGVEIHQSRRPGLDLEGLHQLSVHPQAKCHRSRILRALTGETDLQLVVRVEVEAMGRFDVARINAAQVLEAEAVLDLDRLGQRSGRDRPLSDLPLFSSGLADPHVEHEVPSATETLDQVIQLPGLRL